MGEVTSRIEQSLRERIANDDLLPGGKLPSERAIAAELGVARTTVRLVLLKLSAEGAIRAEHGRGYFVGREES